MNPALAQEDISTRLLSFIRDSFLSGDSAGELDEETPLLELGILNSLNTATLLAYLRDEFALTVPLADVTPANFQSVSALSEMVCQRTPGG
jgi:peptidyl carrier protein